MRDCSPRFRKVKEHCIYGIRGASNKSILLFDWKMSVVRGGGWIWSIRTNISVSHCDSVSHSEPMDQCDKIRSGGVEKREYISNSEAASVALEALYS
jgi:hypothetical protein